MKFVLKFAMSMAAALGLILGVGASAYAVSKPVDEFREHAADIAVIFDLHNKERVSRGLTPLVLSYDISIGLSQPFTNIMANKGEAEIWHNKGEEMLKFGNYAGENVAMRSNGTGALLHEMWMNSQGHKENILRHDFRIMAVGYANADAEQRKDWDYSTVNFFGSSKVAGKTFKTGAEFLNFMNGGSSPNTPAPSTPPSDPNVNVYLTEGQHNINGRLWRTKCEPYSQTKRCTTEIWATQTTSVNGKWVSKNDWVFNNLTYAPSPRTLWKNNPLGGNGVVNGTVKWKAVDGRQWRTECDTAVTGRNGCRSYINATIVESYKMSNGNTGFRYANKEIFNNMTTFN